MNLTTNKQRNPYSQNLKKEQDELVLQYLPAVRAMAYRLRERLPASVDVNDLISIGTEEMIKLSRRYDKEQNDYCFLADEQLSQLSKFFLKKTGKENQ